VLDGRASTPGARALPTATLHGLSLASIGARRAAAVPTRTTRRPRSCPCVPGPGAHSFGSCPVGTLGLARLCARPAVLLRVRSSGHRHVSTPARLFNGDTLSRWPLVRLHARRPHARSVSATGAGPRGAAVRALRPPASVREVMGAEAGMAAPVGVAASTLAASKAAPTTAVAPTGGIIAPTTTRIRRRRRRRRRRRLRAERGHGTLRARICSGAGWRGRPLLVI
jgi:hypothetical protein